jgi:Flp pilus assembly protein TadD
MTSYAPRGYSPSNSYHPSAAKPGAMSLARAQVAVKAKNHSEAVEWFKKALAEAPADQSIRVKLGQSLYAAGRDIEGAEQLAEAGRQIIEAAKRSLDVKPLLELTARMQQLSDFSAALRLGNEAIAIDPSSFFAFQQLAVSYSQLNRTQDALQAGERALALAPDHQMMHILQASLEADANQTEAARLRLETVLTQTLSPREEFRARKELARVQDRLGRFDQVFGNLHKAAACSISLPEFASQNKSLVPKMLSVNTSDFDKELLGRWSASEFPKDQPPLVFVLGFMRSGTTLTQEVLDAHPDVLVADEVDFVWTVHRELHRMNPSNASTAEKLGLLDFKGILHLRDIYWRRVHQRYGDRLAGKIFVDKNAMATVDLGLINVIFPDAKVVFVMRDPRDICVSCYMQLMVPSPSTVHLLSWEGTAEFYASVMNWWIHIRKEMSLPFVEFRYEDAVLQFEPTFKRVLDFMGCGWDASVADFHIRASKKFISTPSRKQVSQPIYTSSVTRWRNFEGEFAGIANLLTPYVKAFNYEPF